LRSGENPVAARREKREAALADTLRTFGRVGNEYLQLDTTKSPATADKHNWLFRSLSKFHGRPLSSIQTSEIVQARRSYEAAGKSETAHRLAAFAAAVFRYAVRSWYIDHSPNSARDLRGALKPIVVESHAGITDPRRFGILMKYIESDDYSFIPVRHALRLIARTAVRPGELRAMEWSELDLPGAQWNIPAIRMKMRRPHWVPLSRQAVQILKAQQAISGDGRYVFPSSRSTRRPMSDGAMNGALATLGNNKGGWLTVDEHTPHGFRTSFSTLMNAYTWTAPSGDTLRTDPRIIELCLMHGKDDKIAKIYKRHEYQPERCELMQRWADYIDELTRQPLPWTRATS
jgi:integrase